MKIFKKSNKRRANSAKYLQDILQLGNFIVKKYGDGEVLYVRVCTADGSWRIDFREDSFKYAWILMLSSEQRYHEILKAWITVSYHTTMCNPDPVFLENIIQELHSLGERAQKMEEARQKETTKSPDNEI